MISVHVLARRTGLTMSWISKEKVSWGTDAVSSVLVHDSGVPTFTSSLGRSIAKSSVITYTTLTYLT